jgi:hypothetical protein
MSFGQPVSPNVISLIGYPIELANYSQNLIELKYYPVPSEPLITTSYYLDKKITFVQLQTTLPSDPTAVSTTISLSTIYGESYQFQYYDVTIPVISDAQELVNTIAGWLGYISDVSVNGGSPVQLFNTLNLIEGSNITIVTTPDPINNVLDVTISASGGGGVTTFSGGTTGLTPAAPTSGAVTLAGTLVVANGGTGLSALGSGLQYLRVNAGATALEYATFPSVVTDDPFPKILMLMGG